MENNLIPETKQAPNNFLYVASFLETQRNYITSPFFPAVASAEDVFNNLNNYLLIDIRSSTAYSEGHLPNSINVQPKDLMDYIDELGILKDSESQAYARIIIISLTGQKAAYVTALLRLRGVRNVYSLNYGLGYWNKKYSPAWLKAKGNSQYVTYYKNNYEPSKINSISDYPSSQFDESELTLENRIDNRIHSLMAENIESYNATIEEFEDNFDRKGRKYNRCKVIFFGESDVFNYVYKYSVNILHTGFYTGVFNVSNSFTLRPKGTQRFDKNNIGLSTNLLSLPTDKLIYIYSVDGQESAAVTAYLNVLGYKARSIRFGSYGMYSRYFNDISIRGTITWINDKVNKGSVDTVYIQTPISEIIFDENLIQDFPVESGN